jgi:hypothetical protein
MKVPNRSRIIISLTQEASQSLTLSRFLKMPYSSEEQYLQVLDGLFRLPSMPK